RRARPVRSFRYQLVWNGRASHSSFRRWTSAFMQPPLLGCPVVNPAHGRLPSDLGHSFGEHLTPAGRGSSVRRSDRPRRLPARRSSATILPLPRFVASLERKKVEMNLKAIDHVAISVKSLEDSFRWYSQVLGFGLYHKFTRTWMIERDGMKIGLM